MLKGENKDSHKSREQREILFSLVFLRDRQTLGVMLLKTTEVETKTFLMKKFKRHAFVSVSPTGLRSLVSLERERERGEPGSRAVPGCCPSRIPASLGVAAPAPRSAAGGRRAQEGSRAPCSSPAPGTAPGLSHEPETRTDSGSNTPALGDDSTEVRSWPEPGEE